MCRSLQSSILQQYRKFLTHITVANTDKKFESECFEFNLSSFDEAGKFRQSSLRGKMAFYLDANLFVNGLNFICNAMLYEP